MTGTPKQRQTLMVVTGFGPFGGVEKNPSNILISELPEYLSPSTAATKATASWKAEVLQHVVLWHVVETSTQGVQESLDTLKDQVQRTVVSKERLQDDISVIYLHLGVNVFGKGYHFESSAYNDASFRIPDERGNKPSRQPIVASQQLGSVSHTTLDLQSLVSHQLTVFPAVLSRVSTDPGRFVCNYLYYSSLHQLTPEEETNVSLGRSIVYQSFFLHIPSFGVVPKEVQLEYLAELLRVLVDVPLS